MKLTAGGSRKPAPEGTHIARCYAVIDIGTQTTEYKNKPKKARKILLGFELPTEKTVFDEAKGEEPFSVWERYTASLHQKAVLRGLLESWRGRNFTEDELKGFEPKTLLTRPALLTVVHEEDYANIKGIVKPPASMECPPAINKPIYLSLEPGEFDRAVYDSLSDRLKETIAESPEFKALGESAPASNQSTSDDGW